MGKVRLTADERCQQIIEKAAEVFAKKGLIGTRTRDIAEACGVNEALLYRHFNSKEEIFHEAIINAYDEGARTWPELFQSQPNVLLGLVEIVKAQISMLSEDPVLCANIWHGVAASVHDPVLRDLIYERFSANHEILRDFIIMGKEQGLIKDDLPPDLCAWFLRGFTWCCIVNTLLGIKCGDDTDTVEKLCGGIIQILASPSYKAEFPDCKLQ